MFRPFSFLASFSVAYSGLKNKLDFFALYSRFLGLCQARVLPSLPLSLYNCLCKMCFFFSVSGVRDWASVRSAVFMGDGGVALICVFYGALPVVNGIFLNLCRMVAVFRRCFWPSCAKKAAEKAPIAGKG